MNRNGANVSSPWKTLPTMSHNLSSNEKDHGLWVFVEHYYGSNSFFKKSTFWSTCSIFPLCMDNIRDSVEDRQSRIAWQMINEVSRRKNTAKAKLKFNPSTGQGDTPISSTWCTCFLIDGWVEGQYVTLE